MKRGFTNKKLFSIFITLSVVLLLLMLGPVQALIVGFSVVDGIITQGELAEFEVDIEIEQGEILDVQNLTLLLEGPVTKECIFLPDGTPITQCEGIIIELLDSPPYHYSYGYHGYTEGFLEYDIFLDSLTTEPGQYQSKMIIATPEEIIMSPEQLIYIQPPELVQSCSLRAKGGVAELDEEIFTNRNRLNLYVPSGSAIDGEGTFTAQNGQRISYSYQVLSASQIGENIIQFEVLGELRKHPEVYQESATIIFDRSTSTIEIDGDTLEAENMEINFLRC